MSARCTVANCSMNGEIAKVNYSKTTTQLAISFCPVCLMPSVELQIIYFIKSQGIFLKLPLSFTLLSVCLSVSLCLYQYFTACFVCDLSE